MNVLIAPSGCRDGLSAEEAADAMACGVRAALPTADVLKAPLVDCGEGFARAVVRAGDGELYDRNVTGPTGQRLRAHFGLVDTADGRLGVVEVAAAAGLKLIPAHERDPRHTTSTGVGELMGAALAAGAERLLIGCGASGLSDGGAGMAQALGVRLLDDRDQALGWGGGELHRLRRIDLSSSRVHGREVPIDVAVNWHNALVGPYGVARVHGPHKGASPGAVRELEAGLHHYAEVIRLQLGIDVARMAGAGASGGLGAGLVAFFGARLHPRSELVLRHLGLDALLEQANVVLTADGQFQRQLPQTNATGEVARRARRLGLPVITLSGGLFQSLTGARSTQPEAWGRRAQVTLQRRVDALFGVVDCPPLLSSDASSVGKLLEESTANALRALGGGLTRLLEFRAEN